MEPCRAHVTSFWSSPRLPALFKAFMLPRLPLQFLLSVFHRSTSSHNAESIGSPQLLEPSKCLHKKVAAEAEHHPPAVELASLTNPLGQTLRYIHHSIHTLTYLDHPPPFPPQPSCQRKRRSLTRINPRDLGKPLLCPRLLHRR